MTTNAREGFSFPDSEDRDASLGRRFASPGWWVPVQVDVVKWPADPAARIHWYAPIGRRRQPTSGMLDEFLELAESSVGPGKIQRFARRWGLLGGMTIALRDDLIGLQPDADMDFTEALEVFAFQLWTLPRIQGRGGWEAVEAWRYFASQASALLRVADHLRRGEAAPPADVLAIYEPAPLPEVWSEGTRLKPSWAGQPELLESPPMKPSVRAQRQVVERWIQRWLHHGHVRLHFTWNGPDAAIQFGGSGLFGALAIQLAQAVSGRGSLRMCAACGKPYAAFGRQLRYCDACGLKAAQRIASSSYRRRTKAETLARAGFSVKAIAKQCETDPTTIRGWLSSAQGPRTRKRMSRHHSRRRARHA